ncbi:hypothetical protein GCM10009037_12510 [Halarchaeum grantii]|uniref:DUF8060 domain-containing protein n=1 Tax=Halarchaeum grantii TaxID=1193105 RepID=A0A830F8S0_9EURY|nr:hypothetical protein [Halarchaeum grantii]GGL30324.1 hypothetical protein GCM10009037_12510 [Halarchaeum grantii]
MSDPARDPDEPADAVERVDDASATGADDGAEPAGSTDSTGRSLVRVARWLGIAIAGVLALVAAVNLYTTVGTLIGVWASARYQPLFRAGFDVVVLLVAAAVVARLARDADAFS